MFSMLPSTTLGFRDVGQNLKYTTVEIAIQQQERTQWCWAAVAMGMSTFFDAGSSWTQCSIATQVTGGACCGPQQDDEGCDIPEPLEAVLQSVGVTTQRSNVFDITAIAHEIVNEKRPVAIRVEWTDSGHVGEGQKLEAHGFLLGCYGASLNVFPSRMAREMGSGSHCQMRRQRYDAIDRKLCRSSSITKIDLVSARDDINWAGSRRYVAFYSKTTY